MNIELAPRYVKSETVVYESYVCRDSTKNTSNVIETILFYLKL